MTPLQALARAWDVEPSVAVGCAALALARAAADRFRPARGWIPWGAGVAVLFLALSSPLDLLADAYLFSAHMVQHMLLAFAVAPLLVAGAPAGLLRRALRRRWVAGAERLLGTPAVACLVAAATLAAWHVPALYDAAVDYEGIHVVEHLCLLAAFAIYWWPVATPLRERRLAPPAAIAHLAVGAVATSAVGIFVTFSGAARWRSYAGAEDPLGLEPLLLAAGLGRADDLQLSGLLMWMGGTPVFLGAALGALRRWYEADAVTAQRAEAR